MSAFAVMRMTKLKNLGHVASSLKHTFREQETPNADQAKTPTNKHLEIDGQRIDSTDSAMGRLRSILPTHQPNGRKVMSNAVPAIEYIFTTSPEWSQTASEAAQEQFFTNSLQWLADKYGRENVFCASVHRDERTPHMAAYVVPICPDGRLSAKEMIGDRTKMSRDQDTFAEIQQDLGLQRGVRGSKAKHQSIQKWYARLEEGVRGIAPKEFIEATRPRVFKKNLLGKDDIEDYRSVAKRLYQEYVAPAMSALRVEENRVKTITSKQTYDVPKIFTRSQFAYEFGQERLKIAAQKTAQLQHDHAQKQKQPTRNQDQDISR